MERYTRDAHHDTQPLDAESPRHDLLPHNADRTGDYYRPDPGYYDTSPRYETRQPAAGTTHEQWLQNSDESASAGPVPPRHGQTMYEGRSFTNGTAYGPDSVSTTITAGADNFSERASGGMVGIAHNVAERNARMSGVEAFRSTGQVPPPPSRSQLSSTHQESYTSPASGGLGPDSNGAYGQNPFDRDSQSSLSALGLPATPRRSRSPHNLSSGDLFLDDPYQGYSSNTRNGEYRLGVVDPNDIEDDGDDGLYYSRHSQRNSIFGTSQSERTGHLAAAAGSGANSGGFVNKNSDRLPGGLDYDLRTGREKNTRWFASKKNSGKRWKLIILISIFVIIVGAIIGGVVGGLLSNNKKDGGDKSKGDSAQEDTDKNGLLDINSKEIKDLLGNPNLHKVFPGMDYTPLNTQYPDCLENPPSQNNVTRDVAVLSQLTNKIRLYGTDCNQTEMVIEAVNRLKMTDDIKIWMGVWQNGNDTTNERQLRQMWNILDQYSDDIFEGIIVANEIIFREEMTISTLGDLLDSVKKNLTSHGHDLPVATSDLGDDWTAELAKKSDYIMANIHPFFSGTPASKAAAWTSNFWETKDGEFFKSNKSRNIISETGWPTGGGTNCGSSDETSCNDGAVAGIDELNQFMEDWVCSALKNGTNYFWFEAFDEPWKVQFNTKGKNWEDKWGLLDVNRVLKDGVKIPDCDGAIVS